MPKRSVNSQLSDADNKAFDEWWKNRPYSKMNETPARRLWKAAVEYARESKSEDDIKKAIVKYKSGYEYMNGEAPTQEEVQAFIHAWNTALGAY